MKALDVADKALKACRPVGVKSFALSAVFLPRLEKIAVVRPCAVLVQHRWRCCRFGYLPIRLLKAPRYSYRAFVVVLRGAVPCSRTVVKAN